MKKIFVILTILALSFFSNVSMGESEHDHDHEKQEAHAKSKDHKDEEHDHDEGEEHDDHDEDNEDKHGHDKHEKKGSHDHGDEHGEEAFGEGKALTAVYNEGEKFKLSKESEKLLGIKTQPLESVSGTVFRIPSEALVRYQGHLGVFVKQDEWFELIELKKVTHTKEYVAIESPKLRKGMQIAHSGVPLLRVAHLQASGQGGKGHAH